MRGLQLRGGGGGEHPKRGPQGEPKLQHRRGRLYESKRGNKSGHDVLQRCKIVQQVQKKRYIGSGFKARSGIPGE